MRDALEAHSHLGLSPPGTTRTHGAKGVRQVSRGGDVGFGVGGVALRELGAEPAVGDVHADKGRQEV